MNQTSVQTTLDLSGPPAAGTARQRPSRAFAPVLLLAAATLAAHGRGMVDGLFLDDHLHMTRYADDDWSLGRLLDATTIVPEEFMHTWWQEQPIQWQYARPVSVLLAKAVYQLSGGSVKALHGLSLGLHVLSALLVYELCRRLTRRTGWSLIGGLLFVIHSHSVYSVGWLAAQNSVLQTVLTLGALLSYARASGLNLYAGVERAEPAPRPEAASPAGRWFALTLLLWVLAMFSRENALVFPGLALALDLAFGGCRHVRRRLPAYVLMGVMAAAFAIWRLKFFYLPMPRFYVRTYDGPEYIAWWVAKLLHWITGVVWLSPLMIGPSARFNPFREVPGDCLLMLAIITVMSTGYVLACRKAKGWWLWPAWILLALLPVVPVFAGPQSAYMPAVGFAVAMVLGPALRHEIRPVSIGRWSPGVAIWFLVATTTYIPVYQTFWTAVQSAERLTIRQMAADPPPPEVTDLFLINVPFLNIYTRYHLQEELAGTRSPPRDVRCHVLTYAPNVLRMEEDCRLEQIDAHSFRLSVEGTGYFSGALGRYLIESMRPAGRFRTDDVVRGDWFDVWVTRAGEAGVQELQFRFREPLASPQFCFYVGTNRRSATRVRFGGQEPSADARLASAGEIDKQGIARAADRLNRGEAAAGTELLRGLRQPALRDAAMAAFRQAALPMAEALAAGEREILARPVWSESDELRLDKWWSAAVDDRNLAAVWVRREEWESLAKRRDRLFEIQKVAGRIIATDLYLTGPPFPGPR